MLIYISEVGLYLYKYNTLSNIINNSYILYVFSDDLNKPNSLTCPMNFLQYFF